MEQIQFVLEFDVFRDIPGFFIDTNLNIAFLLNEMKYYIDTCVWIDIRENRFGQNRKPLGKLGLALLLKIQREKTPLL